jgi:hypothetical protein
MALDIRAKHGLLDKPDAITPMEELQEALLAAPFNGFHSNSPAVAGGPLGGVSAALAFADPANVQIVFVYRRNRGRSISQAEELLTGLRALPRVNVSIFDDNGQGYHPEAWPLFRTADVVVGPHGSALTHITAMRPGGVVVEVAIPDLNMCFMHASYKLGLRHHLLLHEDSMKKDGNVHVEVTAALATITGAINDAVRERQFYGL